MVGLLSRDPRHGQQFGNPKHARSPVCSAWRGEKRRERWRKGENSFVPGCILLRLWFPSTANVNKQRRERGKHGQTRGGKKTGGGGGRKRPASKNILARCVRYKSPAHLLVSQPDKNTHSLATQIWLADTHSSQRSLCESCDKLLTHFNINLSDDSCEQSCFFSED